MHLPETECVKINHILLFNLIFAFSFLGKTTDISSTETKYHCLIATLTLIHNLLFSITAVSSGATSAYKPSVLFRLAVKEAQ